MNKNESIQGFPTITIRDKNTGNIISEKTLKNSASVIVKSFFSDLISKAPHNTGLPFFGKIINFEQNRFVIGTCRYKIPKISRFFSLYLESYRDLFGNYYTSFNDVKNYKDSSGEDVISQTTVDPGVNRLKSINYNDDGTIYIEYYGQLKAPESGTRTISSIFLGYSQSRNSNEYIKGNASIIALVPLDEEIVQDDTMIIDITYKVILPKDVVGVSKYIYNYSKNNLIKHISGKNEIKDVFLFEGEVSSRFISTSILDYDHIPEKYNYIQKYYSLGNITDINYYNNIDQRLHYSYNKSGISVTKPYNASFNKNEYGKLIKYVYSKDINGASVKYLDLKEINEGNNRYIPSPLFVNSNPENRVSEKIDIPFPISANVYSHHKKEDGTDRPFTDIQSYRKGLADVSVNIDSYNSDFPEMYFLDIVRGGEQGVARGKITKRPFFGTLNYKFHSGSYNLGHISSDKTRVKVISNNNINVNINSTDSIFKHKYGYEYQNAGDRHPLSDGHILVVTRKGVLLTHIKIVDYEIYDKDSTPQLPVKMITSIAHNYNTGDTFIGCAETGLYKFNKSLRNSNAATIEKIPGIEKVYTMNTDGYGNISIVTNQGLKITKNNCQSFETFDHTRMNSSEITSNEDFIKINTLATDFESENLNTMMVYSRKVKNNLFLYFSKDGSGSEISEIPEVSEYNNTINDISWIKSFNPEITFPAYSAYITEIKSIRSAFLRTPRNIDSVLDLQYINEKSKTEGHEGVYALKMLENGNFIPSRLISFSNGKFYLNICGVFYGFDFNSNSFSSISRKKVFGNDKRTSFNSITSSAEPYSFLTPRDFPVLSSSVILDDNSSNINHITHRDLPGINVDSLSTTLDPDRIFLDTSLSGYSAYDSGYLYSSSSYTESNSSKFLSFMLSNIRNESDFSVFDSNIDNSSFGSIILDEFKDSGLILVTVSEGNHLVNSPLVRETVADEDFNSIFNNSECINSGMFASKDTYLWNGNQPIGRRFGVTTDKIDKIVQINGQDDFLIPEGKLKVENITINFDSRSGGNKSYVERDYYSFVNFDGIVHDDQTSFNIEFEEVLGEISKERVNQSGVIAKSENTYSKIFSPRVTQGFAAELEDHTWFNTSESSSSELSSNQVVNLGDFKARIDISKAKGIGCYEFKIARINNTSYSSFYLWIGNYKGKTFVFPTTANVDVSVSESNINKNLITSSDILTVEFSATNRSFIVRKNGGQIYTSGSMDSGSIPLVTAYPKLRDMLIGPGGCKSSNSFYYTYESNFTPWSGPSMIPPLIFEYSNRGYPLTVLGDQNGNTGIHDPKFIGISCIEKSNNLSINIDKKPASIIYKSYNISALNPETSEVNLEKISKVYEMTSNIYPTALKSGEVMVFHDTGIVMFSQEDIGKKYSIDYRWYRDQIFGVDEFAEESDIPRDPE